MIRPGWKGPKMAQLRLAVVLAALAALVCTSLVAATESKFGHFVGEFVAKFGEDGRNVILEKPFAYVDTVGNKWDVPVGTETDGASVPSVFWALYPPFTGPYRSAAVIHDYYCATKTRSWQDTHKVFYFAMRAANVDEKTAKVLFGAVYMFGPRWGPGTSPGQRNAAVKATPEQQEAVVKELQDLVAKENPDLESLVAQAKRMGARATGTRPQPAE